MIHVRQQYSAAINQINQKKIITEKNKRHSVLAKPLRTA
jgi:hypothetical protein